MQNKLFDAFEAMPNAALKEISIADLTANDTTNKSDFLKDATEGSEAEGGSRPEEQSTFQYDDVSNPGENHNAGAFDRDNVSGAMGDGSQLDLSMLNEVVMTDLLDLVIVTLTTMLFKWLAQKTIHKSQVRADAKEKAIIQPLMKKCLEQMKVNINNPFVALTAAVVIIYGMKILLLLEFTAVATEIKKDGATASASPQTGRKRGPYNKAKQAA